MLYDATRNQVYLSANDHIDVFSVVTNSFAAPIAIPSKSGQRQILGLALTPDGSKLLAANEPDTTVAIVNPDNPSSGAQLISVPQAPFEIATTSTNHAFVTTTGAFNLGPYNIYDIDLSSLQVGVVAVPPGSLILPGASYLKGARNGTLVVEETVGDSGGPMPAWQAATNTWVARMVEGQFWQDPAVAGDGNLSVTTSDPADSGFPFQYVFDPNLNMTAQVNFPEFQALQQGPPVEMEQTGALLYAFTPAGVDVLDARTGQLREHIVLSEQLATPQTGPLQTQLKMMAVTPAGDEIFVMTTAGLTAVELDEVPLGIGSVTPAAGAAGSTVTIRGTGFTSNTAVNVNGTAANTTLVDASTITATIPAGAQKGAAQFTLMNANGSTYSLDSAFQVQ